VEVTNGDKHPSLLQYGINYSRKQFYVLGPWNCFETFMLLKIAKRQLPKLDKK